MHLVVCFRPRDHFLAMLYRQSRLQLNLLDAIDSIKHRSLDRTRTRRSLALFPTQRLLLRSPSELDERFDRPPGSEQCRL